MDDPRLLFAMHDVTPFHLGRLQRAEELLSAWGVREATYLFIPNFFGAYSARESAAFREWCFRPRTFRVNWFLHGYYHLRCEDAGESTGTESRISLALNWIHRADEGEFRTLGPATICNRLDRGLEEFAAFFGDRPTGFVPPKWQYNEHLAPALLDRGFRWVEGDRGIQTLQTAAELVSPVITWATRSLAKKYLSLAGASLLSKWVDRTKWLRIAVHPFDFDHPQTVASIKNILCRAMNRRQQASYSDLPT